MSNSCRQHATVEEIIADIKAHEAIAESIAEQLEYRKDRTGPEHEAWAIRARDKRAYTLKTIADLKRRLGGSDPTAPSASDNNAEILREHNALLTSRVAELTSRVAELESENDNLTARLRVATTTRS